MELVLISLLSGIAGYSFVLLCPWPKWAYKHVIKGKPLNCQMCMSFWFGVIFTGISHGYIAPVIVGFASMFFAAFSDRLLYQISRP